MKLSSSRFFSKLTIITLVENQTCGAARPTQPFFGFFMYFNISFHSFIASFNSAVFTSGATVLSISLSFPVSIFSIFLKFIFLILFYYKL